MTPRKLLLGCLLILVMPVLALMALFGWLISRTGIRQDNVDFNVSPDGELLTFSARGDGDSDLYLLHLKTMRVENLVRSPSYEMDPAFSPDGKQVVYAASNSPGEASNLYLCRSDGADRRRVTSNPDVLDSMPSFSRDGSKVVFSRAARHRPYSMGGWTWDDWDIYRINTDGTGLTRLTRLKYYGVFAPHFSPDDRSVLYSAWHRLDGTSITDVFLVSSDGSKEPNRLTKDGHNSHACFTPDGKQIVVISDRAKPFDYDVWSMGVDGDHWTRITQNRSYNEKPTVSRDGKEVFFLSDPKRASRYDLWAVGIGGKNLRRIADSSLFDEPLNWRPK